jgi:hypothetical protein
MYCSALALLLAQLDGHSPPSSLVSPVYTSVAWLSTMRLI